MSGRILRLPLLVVAALVALPAGAQMYKWTDANGRVQYSDKPPPGGSKAEQVTRSNVSTVQSGSAPAAVGGPKSAAEQEQEFRKRRAEQEEAQKKTQKLAEEQKGKQANCQNAQRQLAAMQSGQRISSLDEKGERRFLEDAEIQQEVAKSQAEVGRWCN